MEVVKKVIAKNEFYTSYLTILICTSWKALCEMTRYEK